MAVENAEKGHHCFGRVAPCSLREYTGDSERRCELGGRREVYLASYGPSRGIATSDSENPSRSELWHIRTPKSLFSLSERGSDGSIAVYRHSHVRGMPGHQHIGVRVGRRRQVSGSRFRKVNTSRAGVNRRKPNVRGEGVFSSFYRCKYDYKVHDTHKVR